jgi:hypothetical protein
MLQHLLGLDLLTAKYDPFTGLQRVNPLLKRELGITEVGNSEESLTTYDVRLFRVIAITHFITIGAFCFSARVPWATVLFLSLPSLVISTGADVYASVRTIFRWHAASKFEAWDTIRMALRDDRELIGTFETIGTVRSWAAYQWDMTMRAAPTIIAAGSGGALIVGSIGYMLIDKRVEPLMVLEFVVMGMFLIRLAILYISDPMWRFRANILWSLLCAMLFRETATAITAAIAGSIGARLLHLIALALLYVVWNAVLGDQNIFVGRPDTMLLIRWFAWFSVLAFALLPITRWCFAHLYAWLERRTLLTLRRGDI